MKANLIRNVAVIAHVDHGKTTLVDHLLRQSGLFRENQEVAERLMDSMDLEKERGITIAAKNASFIHNNVKINLVDTPGHSDFGGEVERILDMVDSVLLLVDASEGPLPQTRFVLQKALEQNLAILVIINKVDRKDARPDEVLNEVFDLFIDLGADEEQCNFDVIYAIGREGQASTDLDNMGSDLSVIYQWLIEKAPAPEANPEGPLQALIANIGYNDYVGRLGIGRIRQGTMRIGQDVSLCKENKTVKFRITSLLCYLGNQQAQVESLAAGDIAIFSGHEEIGIGDTVAAAENPVALPRLRVDEPTVSILLSVNDGPMAGKEGDHVTSRKLKERLDKELRQNVALRVEDTERTDTWRVSGRGELQLAILLETMRREGYEALVSQPQVIYKIENGQKMEPMEEVVVDVDENYSGIVTEKLGKRKGILTNMVNKGSGRTRIEFRIPSRGLIGYRSEFLTDTRGTGLLNTQFGGYEAYKGEIVSRQTGSIVSDRAGKSTAYALDTLSDRGQLFITPTEEVYAGMVIGESSKGIELNVNVTKEKKLTNVRASGSDDAIRLAPIQKMTLERAMEWISDEELIEVTPKSIRIRCRVLDMNQRKHLQKKSK